MRITKFREKNVHFSKSETKVTSNFGISTLCLLYASYGKQQALLNGPDLRKKVINGLMRPIYFLHNPNIFRVSGWGYIKSLIAAVCLELRLIQSTREVSVGFFFIRNDRIKGCSSGVSPEEEEERGGVGSREEAERRSCQEDERRQQEAYLQKGRAVRQGVCREGN